MVNILTVVSKWGIVAYLFTSLLPLLKSNHWLIRIWDFPRLQFLIIGLIFGLIFILLFVGKNQTKIIFLSCLVIGAGLDLYRILPYSRLFSKESIQVEPKNKNQTLSLITVNVLQKNEHAQPLLKLIERYSPDMVFLLEINQRWINDLSILDKNYPYKLIRPLENTYGLALFSRLEFDESQIRELVEKDIPSIFVRVKLRSGDVVEIYGLHPRPPHYETGDSTERDAELIQIAKTASQSKLPVIVMGDLNDVAWSHTTRLFRRISQLLDPRVGRGVFPTFPADIPLFRYPLDYVFHSDKLSLVSLERLEDIKSDHFPMFIELNLNPEYKNQQEAPPKNEGDEEEARKTIKKAKEKR